MYGYPMYRFFDPTYILVLIGVISLIASAKLKSTFNKYSQVASRRRMSGAQVAEEILRANGIYDVQVSHVGGSLTDHYDPKRKVLNLSDTVYDSTSIAAIGVAAHECGHAIQHQVGYTPLKFRSALVPVVNFGSAASWFFILGGLFLFVIDLIISKMSITIGIVLFSFAVLFQLVTLPVEYNASARAIAVLGNMGILGEDELGNTRKVLSAAALTYVAGAATAILQLLRLIILFGGNRDD